MDARLMTWDEAMYVAFGLTPRQSEVLLAILHYRAKHGYLPSVRDLMKMMDIRSAGAFGNLHGHYRALERKGAIRIERFQGRTVVPRLRWIPAEELCPAS
jgi:SOS-response transcriptional repressor LexA